MCPNSDHRGVCDTSIVESVIADLLNNSYGGVIVIKSTVPPGTTKKMQDIFQAKNICFVPEFLKRGVRYLIL